MNSSDKKNKWQIKKLREILKIYDNGVWGPEDKENGIPILRSTNFSNGGEIDFSNVAKRRVEIENLKEKRLMKGDILLERSGGGPKQPVGRVVYFDSDGEYYFGNFITRLRAHENVYSKYLFFYLFYIHQSGITNRLQKQTTGIRNLRFKQYLNLPIPLPPLPLQKKIVAKIEEIFEKIDKAIKLREEIIKETEEIFNMETHRIFEEVITHSKIKKLGDKIKLLKGKKPKEFYEVKTENTAIYLTAQYMRGFEKPRYCSINDDVIRVEKNDVIMIMDGSYSGDVFIGFEGVLASTMAKFLFNPDEIYPKYLYFFLKNNFEILNSRTKGAATPHVRKDVLFNLPIPLPPLPVQKKIVSYLDSLREKTETLKNHHQSQLKELKELKQSILYKAFKGELV